MANYGTILVVDDNPAVLTALKICLDGVFDRIITQDKPDHILVTLNQERVDLNVFNGTLEELQQMTIPAEGKE